MTTLPVRIRPGAVIVTAFVGVLMGVTVLPASVPDLSGSAYLAGGVAAGLVLLLLVAVGQLTTAVAARRSGLTVDRVDLGLFGDPGVRGEPATPGRLARVSVSGPLATAAVAVAVVGAAVALEQGIGRSVPAAVLGWSGQTALLLAGVSLLPIGPMPGNRLLTALLWWRRKDQLAGRAAAAQVARAIGVALIGAGVVLTLLFGLVGAWATLAGWLVLSSASRERRALKAQAALASLRVRDVMTQAPDAVPGWLSVEAALDRLPAARHGLLAVQGFDGKASGVVPVAALAVVPEDRRATVRMSALVLPATAARLVAADEPATVLLEASPRSRPTVALVVDAAWQPVGLVTAQEIARAVERSPSTPAPIDVRGR